MYIWKRMFEYIRKKFEGFMPVSRHTTFHLWGGVLSVSLLQRQPTPLEKFVGPEKDRLLLSLFDQGCNATYAGRKRERDAV